jgi:GT2 family glycosyltransferase
MSSSLSIGVVVIGRNEGDRLKQCLLSLLPQTSQIVYVDSGSTDGSVELAQSLNVEVVALDMSIPFTAARARNTGVERLISLNAEIQYVQFVDGDCEVLPHWLEQARKTLDENPQVVAVSGRLTERFPRKTLYNYLVNMEWQAPFGEVLSCGGLSMMRIEALQAVGGFNASLIAGEEPELCIRLREKGGKILRIDADMALHDADMTQFSQWWKRNVRGGHSFAQVISVHSQTPKLYQHKERRSIWLWAFTVPLLALGLSWFTHGWSLLLFSGYGVLIWRIYRYQRSQSFTHKDALIYAIFCLLGRFPQLQGQLIFYRNAWLGKRATLIEYKGPNTTPIPKNN